MYSIISCKLWNRKLETCLDKIRVIYLNIIIYLLVWTEIFVERQILYLLVWTEMRQRLSLSGALILNHIDLRLDPTQHINFYDLQSSTIQQKEGF